MFFSPGAKFAHWLHAIFHAIFIAFFLMELRSRSAAGAEVASANENLTRSTRPKSRIFGVQ
jgi:hypothetical protein